MTDATLAALEALKLPLEHDIDDLRHSDKFSDKIAGTMLEHSYKHLVEVMEAIQHDES